MNIADRAIGFLAGSPVDTTENEGQVLAHGTGIVESTFKGTVGNVAETSLNAGKEILNITLDTGKAVKNALSLNPFKIFGTVKNILKLPFKAIGRAAATGEKALDGAANFGANILEEGANIIDHAIVGTRNLVAKVFKGIPILEKSEKWKKGIEIVTKLAAPTTIPTKIVREFVKGANS